jgi:phosphatidylglycerophosphatase A
MTHDQLKQFFKGSAAREAVSVFIGSGFGLGLSPIMPGTCGALPGLAAHLLIATYLPSEVRWYALVLIFIIICITHFLLTPWAVEHWRSKDPRHFVLDEIAGYLLVPILYPYGSPWHVALWGFLLFRVFDIIKIPPARQIDSGMPGAWGILLDDLVSSGYAVLAIVFLNQLNII